MSGVGSLIVYEVSINESEKKRGVLAYAKSLFSRISYSEDLNRQHDAYSDLILQFGGSDNPDLQRLIALVKIDKGIALSKLEKSDEAIELYDSLAVQYHNLDGVENQYILARLLYAKAGILWKSKHFDLAILEYDNLVVNFEHSKEDKFGYVVAQAIFSKANVLNETGLIDDEIATYDQLVSRFGSLEKLEYKSYIAKALYLKAIRLTKLGRFEESLRTYDHIIKKFKVLVDDYMGSKNYTPVAERPEFYAYFGDKELKDEISNYLISSLINSTEISFFIENHAATLSRAEEGLSKISPVDDKVLMYEFFIYAAKNDDASHSKICDSIESLTTRLNLSWDFAEIDLLMVEVFGKERSELALFASFLKGEINKAELSSVCRVEENSSLNSDN